MDDLFKQLNAIESAASSILEKASEQKQALAAEYDKKKADFDHLLHEQTEQQILARKTEISARIERELQAQRDQTETLLQQMDQEYAQNHSMLARQLLQDLIRE